MLHIYTNGITHTYNQVSLSVIHSLITIFHYFNMHTKCYINQMLFKFFLVKILFNIQLINHVLCLILKYK